MPGSPQPDKGKAPPRAARRDLVLGGLALAGLGGLGLSSWFNLAADVTGTDMTAAQAWQAATRGDILLIDIRRPDEWRRTGIGQGAVPLDMRRADFLAALRDLTQGQTDLPVALICARGVRSARLAARLQAAGFTHILDVPEGMLGSGAGPGWRARNLPLIPYPADS